MRTCRDYEPARSLETVRVEGLANTQACSEVIPDGSALPAGSRKVSTQWHPSWAVAVKIAEPGRITTSVYNGQPDPFNGNAIANCVPAGATLSNGQPLLVLCRRVEQATTDANGAQAFAAAPRAGSASRENKWTYNARGQVLTHDGHLQEQLFARTGSKLCGERHCDDPQHAGRQLHDLRRRKLRRPPGGGQLVQHHHRRGPDQGPS